MRGAHEMLFIIPSDHLDKHSLISSGADAEKFFIVSYKFDGSYNVYK